MKNKVRFNSMDWESPLLGMKQKLISFGDRQMRLVRFTDNFIEEDWCNNSHYGFVLEGKMKIDFQDNIVSYQKGDGLLIDENIPHKAIIEKGKFVEILLFEKNKNKELQ